MTTQYRVYSDAGTGVVDYTSPLATITSGTSWSSPPLAVGSTDKFAVRASDSVTGLEERNVDALICLITDGSGLDVSAVPAPPVMLSALPTIGGSAVLDWVYVPAGKPRATSFQVFANAGTTITTTTPATATVSTIDGVNYRATLSGIPDAQAWTVVVRTVAASGTHADSRPTTFTGSANGPIGVDSSSVVATAV